MSPTLAKLSAQRISLFVLHEKQGARVRAARKKVRAAERCMSKTIARIEAIHDAISAQAEKEGRCIGCLADLAAPEAAGGEGGFCGPCAEVPF